MTPPSLTSLMETSDPAVSAKTKKKLISIVIPAYNEEAVVDELVRRLQQVFSENSRYDFEVIVVENGSEDRTYEKLLAIHEQDKRFKILQLSRNFRCDGGITAGLQFAGGGCGGHYERGPAGSAGNYSRVSETMGSGLRKHLRRRHQTQWDVLAATGELPDVLLGTRRPDQ